MRARHGPPLIAAALAVLGCKPTVQLTPAPAEAPAEAAYLTGASIMIGAGDISGCDNGGDGRTAMVVDSVLRADSVAKVSDAVFTLGDNAYNEGTAAQFKNCFGPTWGDSAKRIMKKIHPAPGNHEYLTRGANPYYDYFKASAGTAGEGYYSYDVGVWHVVVLNSEIVVNAGFSASQRRQQEDWLIKDLKDHAKQTCTLAYWHNPRFSSGWHGSDASFIPIWQILYDNNVDLVLNGHDHDYERFSPQTPLGVPDTVRGIIEIVVGTGGEELRGFGSNVIRNSVAQIEGRFGVLKLTLGAGEFRSIFIDDTGKVWDPSGGKCH
jgi:hypothetical protein